MREFEVRYAGKRGDYVVSDVSQTVLHCEHGVTTRVISIYDGEGVWEADYDLQFVDIVKAAVLLYNHELINDYLFRTMLQQFETDI
jgi:hypothetical protein